MATTYKIGEAAALLNLKTYVLRFWETEFPQIAPLRTEKGQRLYTDEHVALLRRIRFLLHERGLTIEGARKVLAEEGVNGARSAKAGSLSFAMPPADDAPQAAAAASARRGAAQSEPEAPLPFPAADALRSIAHAGAGLYSTASGADSAMPRGQGSVQAAYTAPAARPQDSFWRGIASELEHVIALLRGETPGNTLQ